MRNQRGLEDFLVDDIDACQQLLPLSGMLSLKTVKDFRKHFWCSEPALAEDKSVQIEPSSQTFCRRRLRLLSSVARYGSEEFANKVAYAELGAHAD